MHRQNKQSESEKMKDKKGQRIGAILGIVGAVKTINLLGYGNYLGEEVPPEDVSPFLYRANVTNPKLKLDDGSIVWGCECWWGSEEEIKDVVNRYEKQGYKVLNTSLRGPEDEKEKDDEGTPVKVRQNRN